MSIDWKQEKVMFALIPGKIENIWNELYDHVDYASAWIFHNYWNADAWEKCLVHSKMKCEGEPEGQR